MIRRLQEYERYKTVSKKIDAIPRVGRDFFVASSGLPEFESSQKLPEVDLNKLSQIFSELLQRQKLSASHIIEFEKLSTREKMSKILDLLIKEKNIEFHKLCEIKEGKIGIIVNFLALLELAKDSLIKIIQSKDFGIINLSSKDEVH